MLNNNPAIKLPNNFFILPPFEMIAPELARKTIYPWPEGLKIYRKL